MWKNLVRKFRPTSKVVNVVTFKGVIGAGINNINLKRYADTLETAFTGDMMNAKPNAVAFRINSPGGSAAESFALYEHVRYLSQKNKIPVYTFCDEIAASGGYYLMLAGSELYANPFSITGSIGVIHASLGFQKVVQKLGVEPRVHAIGEYKPFMNPLLEQDPKHVEMLTDVMRDTHKGFVEDVLKSREKKLTVSVHEVCNGGIFSAQQAKKLGLIDDIGTLHAVMRNKYGDDVHFNHFKPTPNVMTKLTEGTSTIAENVMLGALQAIDKYSMLHVGNKKSSIEYILIKCKVV